MYYFIPAVFFGLAFLLYFSLKKSNNAPGFKLGQLFVVIKKEAPGKFEGDLAFLDPKEAEKFKEALIDFEKYEVRPLNVAVNLLIFQAHDEGWDACENHEPKK
jgi:hypothetical protein